MSQSITVLALRKLAARCETECPSSHLSREIAQRVNWKGGIENYKSGMNISPDDWMAPETLEVLPDFAGDLNAAITLFSYPGFQLENLHFDMFSSIGNACGHLWTVRISVKVDTRTRQCIRTEAHASTLPLAICGAALRFRAALEQFPCSRSAKKDGRPLASLDLDYRVSVDTSVMKRASSTGEFNSEVRVEP